MSQEGFRFSDECRIHTSSDKMEFRIWEYLLGLSVRDMKWRRELNVGFAKRLRSDEGFECIVK